MKLQPVAVEKSMLNLKEKICELMKSKKDIKIAVLGDICLDQYYFIDKSKSEISVETGLETISIVDTKFRLGGAANVAVNLKTLGSNVDVYGVLGSDKHALIVKNLFEELNINTKGLIIQKDNWKTQLYHKMILEGKEISRYDQGNYNLIEKDTISLLCALLSEKINSYDAVIINEQVLNSVSTLASIKELNKVIQKADKKVRVFADTRHFIGKFDRAIYKLNSDEARTFLNSTVADFETAKSLFEKFQRTVIVTLGKNGALLNDGGNTYHAMGIELNCQVDTVGAGDAFLAAFVFSSCMGEDSISALEIANIAATVSIKVLYETGHPSLPSILEEAEEIVWRYNSFLLSNKINYIPNTTSERLSNKKLFIPKIAIFDHDGTISTLRQGWEVVMKQVMQEAIIGEAEISYEEKEVIANHCSQVIDKTTGIQTIIQMISLVDMVKQYGFNKDVKTASEYKAIYLGKLKEAMEDKLIALKQNELDFTDFTMKGSVDFLHFLSANNTRLYLASGTDENDVKDEAKMLGYDTLFNGGIYGSIGDTICDPKKMVMERIIKDVEKMNIDPNLCAVFGDGPVEMREGRKYGFVTVGVLSDEKQRFGRNEAKRNRLLLAGADFLIPDFSQIHKIMEV